MKIILLLLSTIGFISFTAGNFLPECQCAAPIQLATFNVYQQAWSPVKSRRRENLVNFLNGEFADFDVLCVQDLFSEEDREYLIDTVSAKFPFYYSPNETLPDSCIPLCSTQEQINILTCAAIEDCLNKDSDSSAANCIKDRCGSTLNSQSSSCSDCWREGNIIEDFKSCGGLTKTDYRDEVVDFDGIYTSCDTIHNGTSGLTILSKYEILSTDIRFVFPHPFDAHAVINARIRTPIGVINTFCTRLTNNWAFEAMEDEQATNLENVLKYIQEKTGRSQPINFDNEGNPNTGGTSANETVVLLGGFEFSQDIKEANRANDTTNTASHQIDIQGLNEDNYDALIRNGWTDSYLYFRSRSSNQLFLDCTSCNDNNLRLTDSNDEYILDNIFIAQESRVCVSKAKVFATTKTVTAPVNGDFFNTNGATVDVTVPISSHYGVGVWICRSDNAIGNTNDLVDELNNDSGAQHIGASLITIVAVVASILLKIF